MVRLSILLLLPQDLLKPQGVLLQDRRRRGAFALKFVREMQGICKNGSRLRKSGCEPAFVAPDTNLYRKQTIPDAQGFLFEIHSNYELNAYGCRRKLVYQ